MKSISTSKQAGISAISVIVVGALLIVAIAGVVVYRRSSDDPSSPSTSNAYSPAPASPVTNPASEPQPSNSNKFELPELGIKFTVPDSIKDLTYVVEDIQISNEKTAKAAYFSTESLTRADANCAAGDVSIAVIIRGDGQYPNDDTRMSYGPLLKQFPTTFVTFNTSRASCTSSTDAELRKRLNDTTQTLLESVKTVELVQ